MSRLVKIVVAILMILPGLSIPASAEPVAISGKVSASVSKDTGLSLLGTGVVVQLEKYDAETDSYAPVASATAIPSPAPTSTAAPYKFENVKDGTYRVTYPIKSADVATAKVAFGKTVDFEVLDGKISVSDRPSSTIPELRLNAMGWFAVKAIDATGAAISGATISLTGQLNGEDVTYASLVEPNAKGTATFPIPDIGTYSVKISDPSGFNQDFTVDQTFGTLSNIGNRAIAEAKPTQYTPAPAGVISVAVSSSVAGVTGSVAHLLKDDDEVATATADKTGVALLKGIAPGNYTLWIGGPQGSILKDSDGKTVTVTAGQVTNTTETLVAGQTISGTVTGSTDTQASVPVAGVRVDVEAVDADGIESPVSPAVTDATGKYTTNGLSAGTYNLYFYDESSDRQDYRLSSSILGVVVSTANIAKKDVVLPGASVVSGTVTNQSGKLIPNVNVDLVTAYGDIAASTVTDDNGQYKFVRVLPATYSLKFTNDNFRTAYSPDFQTKTDKLSDQDMQLVSGSGITGQVISKGSQQGINGVQVSVYSASGSGSIPVGSVLTQADGTYVFSGLPAGTYRLKFDGTTASPTTDIFWLPSFGAKVNALSFGQAGDVVTKPGQITKDVNPLPTTPWATVQGKVVDEGLDDTGQPATIGLEGATVTLVALDGSTTFSEDTAGDGLFSVSVPDGTYAIKVAAAGFASGYVGAVNQLPGLVSTSSSAVKVEVADGIAKFGNGWDISNWTLDVSGAGGTVKVTVQDDTPTAVTGGVLLAYDSQGKVAAAVSECDENGTFVLSGLKGKYSLAYDSPGEYVKTFVGGGLKLSDPKTSQVIVQDGKTVSLKLSVVALPNLNFKVATDSGSSAPLYVDDLTVEVYTYDSNQWSLNDDLSTSASDGTVSLGLSNGGSYRIRLVPDNPQYVPVWLGSVPLATRVQDAATITMPAVGKPPAMDNAVINVLAGSISGLVTDSFGGQVVNAQVQLLDVDGNVISSAQSREDGIYKIYRLVPGTYSLKFVAEGLGIKFANDVKVRSAQQTPGNMSLNSASGITGLMLADDGSPIVGATVSVYLASGSGVNPIEAVQTGSDGSYNLIGLPANSYKVEFDGTTASVPTDDFWYSESANVETFQAAGSIKTTLGTYRKNIDSKPAKQWALIKGTIRDSATTVSGAAVSLVTVSLATLTGRVISTDLTDEDGNFAFYAPDGAYQIKVQAAGFAAGFIDTTPGNDLTLSPSAVGAAIVTVKDYQATLKDNQATVPGVKADNLQLNLAGTGGTVTVTVKADAGLVVTEGSVTAYDSSGNIAGYDDQPIGGLFSIAGLSGTYRLAFEQPGVYPKTFLGGTAEITDPKTQTVTVSKSSNPSVTINVKALPKLTVNIVNGGTSATAFKEPATVEVYTSSASGDWKLNSDLTQETSSGSVTFGVAAGDQYRIRVVPNDEFKIPVWVGAARFAKSVDSASTISIPDSGVVPTLGKVVIDAFSGAVQGSVLDQDAAGISGATVSLLDASGTELDSTTSRTDGGFRFSQEIPGTYTLKVLADGYAIKYLKPLEIKANEVAKPVVQLTPATGISGRVLLNNATNDPVVNGTVSVYLASGTGSTALQTVQTDENGDYNFIGLPAGSYRIYFNNSTANLPADSFWYSPTGNTDSFRTAGTVKATLGSYASGINPGLADPWTLFTGNIHDGAWAVSGGTVSLISVSLISIASDSSLTTVTDELGNFAIYAPNGAYRIKVAASGYQTGYVDASEVGTPILNNSAASAVVLFVNDGALTFDSGLTDTALQLDLGASGGKISVTVKDELGQPVTEGLVSVYDKTGRVIGTDDASVGGTFTVAGLRGLFRVSYQQDGVFAETFFGDTESLASSGTKTVTVTDGANVPVAIKVKRLPKLAVNILGTGNTAYKQPVLVEVYTQQDGQWKIDDGLTQETSEGSLTIGVANSSQYRIRLVPADISLSPVWLGANSSALSINLAKSILIPEAGAVPAVSGQLSQSAATLTGTVVDSFQNPLVGATVDLLAPDGDLISETVSLEDGSYNFSQLIPGSYKVRFAMEGFADKVLAKSVAPGEYASLLATLDSASGISGRVLGSGLQNTLQIVGGPRRFLGQVAPEDVPVSGAVVGLYLASGNGLTPIRTELTDQDGYFNFSGLLPGSYRIRIDGTVADKPAERVWYSDSVTNATSFDAATTVVAKRGELVTGIDPAPIKFWTVFDGLIKAGANTVAGATVTLTSTSGDNFAGQTDSDGFFAVAAPDGAYVVQVTAAGYPNGYINDTDTGVIIDSNSQNADILTIANGLATFATNLDLMSQPLDLASSGGTLQVQVLDGSDVITDGVVTIYNRAGAVVSYSDTATGGTFNFDGLRGEYKVSYEQAGNYALSFIGGTNSVNDPATSFVNVRDKAVTLAKLNAVALPKLTVNVKSGSASYLQPVRVDVYQQNEKAWEINPDLGGTTFTGSYTFGVARGENYRIQVVPDDLNTTSAWVGSANAASVTDAKTYSIPLTGAAPTLPAVTLGSAVQVTAQLKNSRPTDVENVVANLEVSVGGNFVKYASAPIGHLAVDAVGSATFDRVPANLFPIRIIGSSSNTANTSAWVSSSATPTGPVTSDVLELKDEAVPATLSGSLKTVDGLGVSGQAVTLITDEGDNYDSTVTDSSGRYTFSSLPLGVHLTVNIETDSGFIVPTGNADFIANSGDVLTIDFEQHYSVKFSGIVYDNNGQARPDALVNVYRVSGTKLDIANDDVFSVYTDEEGKWTFDGSDFNAEVGNYAFFADGLDSDFTPAYLGSAECVKSDSIPEFKANCAVAKPTSAFIVTTNKDLQATNVTLVLGAPDTSAPTGVKITKAPPATTTTSPSWSWVGSDGIDGKALRSQVVIASAAYGKPMSAWSDPIDVTGGNYTISGIRGTTYCLSVQMVDKSGNASAFTAPSCTTVAMDDTAMKPVKSALWSQVAVKGAYLGKVTAAKKNAKNAVLNVTKAAAGNSLCIYYVTGPKFGAFKVTINGKKLGKPVATKGKAGQIKSICFVTKIKANSKIVITVPKTGNGVQIDGYAITVAKPAAPVVPANLKLK